MSRTVTCTTPGCINQGVPIEIADEPTDIVQCGPCMRILEVNVTLSDAQAEELRAATGHDLP